MLVNVSFGMRFDLSVNIVIQTRQKIIDKMSSLTIKKEHYETENKQTNCFDYNYPAEK